MIQHPKFFNLFTLLIRYSAILLVWGIGLLCHAYGQNKIYTTKGTEFWVSFTPNPAGNGTPPDDSLITRVYISAEKATTGVISVPLAETPWSFPFTVSANEVLPISIPNTLVNATSLGTSNKGLKIVTQDSVNVFAINRRTASFDAALVLPRQSLQTEYMVIDYAERPATSYYLIVAIEDNTVIEVYDNNRRLIRTVNLNAGQVFLGSSLSSPTTGYRLVSKEGCRPFAVFVGSNVTTVTTNGCTPTTGDALFEQLLPLGSLGTQYIATLLQSRFSSGYLLRIMATDFTQITTITVGTDAPFNLRGGEFKDVSVFDHSYIESNLPIAVLQLCPTASCEGGSRFGDPFMLMLPPIQSAIRKEATVISFPLNDDKQWTHYTNIVTKWEDRDKIFIDGRSVTSSFKQVPGKPDYAIMDDAAAMTLNEGTHTITAPNSSGFATITYGMNNDQDSYGYFGAIGFTQPPPMEAKLIGITPPVCFGDTNGTIQAQIANGKPPYKYVLVDSTATPPDTLKRKELTIEGIFTQDSVPGGNYYLIISDNQGCVKSLLCNVPIPPKVNAGRDTTACINLGIYTLPSPFPNGGKWAGPHLTDSTRGVVDLNKIGIDTVEYIYTYNRVCSDTMKLGVVAPPTAQFTSIPTLPATVELPDSSLVRFTQLKLDNDVKIIRWDFGDGGSANGANVSYRYPRTGTFTVKLTVIDSTNCVHEVSAEVTVVENQAISVPNVFTPNGDNINDRFVVTTKDVKKYEIHIFDRWGKKVFEATDPQKHWDGTLNGNPAVDGVYYFVIKATINSNEVNRTGFVTLIR
jgi:gliding motility-associated-like protein